MKLTVEKAVYGGLGIARVPETEGAQAGKRIFVPYVLPGEEVLVDMREEKRGHAWGVLRDVVAASPLRTAPVCQHFMRCGGCHWQHATATAQTQVQRDVLLETLGRAGATPVPEVSVLQAAPLHYRNRLRLQVQTRPVFAAGQYGQKSHTLVPLKECPIAASVLERCLQSLSLLGGKNAVPDGAEEAEFFCCHDGSSVLLRVFASHCGQRERAQYQDLFAELQRSVPELCGATLYLQDARRSAFSKAQVALRWKAQSLQYRVGAHTYQVGPGSFFQGNLLLLDAFTALVCDGWRGQLAWDLYAGVGLFARVLAENFGHVIAVENAPDSVGYLRENLAGLSAGVVSSTVADFLRKAEQRHAAPPDLVVVDPPRAGLGAGTAQLLARLRPRRIVYVSCDPVTLSRDLKTLIESGHRLERLHLVEMFPQTYHMETVAVLTR